MYTVEYYSNDNGTWERAEETEFGTRGGALLRMRQSASEYPDLPHRIVETIRTTVALAAQGDELCR